MTGLDELLPQIRTCQICAQHLPLGPRPVLQVHRDATILIAGQAPGRRVHLSGIPFQDPSGVRLRAWLGIDEETFFDPRRIAILPMGFCFPGSGKSGDKPPRSECAPAWREAVLEQLVSVRLTLVLGRYAQAYHLGTPERSVTDNVASQHSLSERSGSAWWDDTCRCEKNGDGGGRRDSASEGRGILARRLAIPQDSL